MNCHTGLTHTANTRDRHHAGFGNRRRDPLGFGVTADERADLGGQVPEKCIQAAQWRELFGVVRRADLEYLKGTAEVTQAVFTQIDQ